MVTLCNQRVKYVVQSTYKGPKNMAALFHILLCIVIGLGLVEDEIFKMRRENELEMRRRQKERKKRQKLVRLHRNYVAT